VTFSLRKTLELKISDERSIMAIIGPMYVSSSAAGLPSRGGWGGALSAHRIKAQKVLIPQKKVVRGQQGLFRPQIDSGGKMAKWYRLWKKTLWTLTG